MKLKMLMTVVALALTVPALAHAPKPRHGGRIVLASAFHVEMVVKENALDIYLLDHDDKAVPVTGFKGVAILAVGGKSERVVLEPSSDAQLLSGRAAGTLPLQPKGVVQITPPNGKAVSAKFD